MHVAIDGRELVGRQTGAGRYLDCLLSEWARLDAAGAHSFTVYAHEAVPRDATGLRLTHAVLPGAGGARWEQVTLAGALRRDRPDVLFAPAYTAPLLIAAPVALTIHDVSFVAHPEWFRPRERWRRRIVTRAAARRARILLTDSDFSRLEIEHRLGVPAERIRVVRLGVGRMDGDLDSLAAGAIGRSAPRARPVVLFVGTLLNRRHVPELIGAAARARQRVQGLRLVLVGDNRTWPRQDPAAIAGQLGVSEHVDVRAFVPEEELRELYAAASVFVFLSEYEGFGLTPLEALAAGVPAVVLDTPVAREVYGAAARYVPSPDPEVVSAAIVELLTSDFARRDLLSHAPAVLKRYRWADAAAATLDAIEQAARR